MPKTWEDRTILFCAQLIQDGLQSSTIRCYVSAIKSVLCDDDYTWNENQVLINTLTRACKNVNNRVYIHNPVKKPSLEVILFEVGRIFATQPYLLCLYRMFFALSYYGLFRLGELAKGDHPIKAADVQVAVNKNKMLILLRSSKTHSKNVRPQRVTIAEENSIGTLVSTTNFCPFELMKQFIKLRGSYHNIKEQFFIFRDRTPLTVGNA